MGHTGCLAFLLLVPFAWIILGCVAGSPADNAIGPPPDID
jgi:hypothetical protein